MIPRLIFVPCSGAEHFILPLQEKGYPILRLGLNYDNKRKFPNTDIYTKVLDLEQTLDNKTDTTYVVVQSGTFGISPEGEQWTTADRIFEVIQVLSILSAPKKVTQTSHKTFEEKDLTPPSRVRIFFSFFPCSLQDKAFSSGEAISSKLIFDLFTKIDSPQIISNIEKIGTIDLHAPPNLTWVQNAMRTGKLWNTSIADRLVEKCIGTFDLDNPFILGPDEGAQVRLGLPGFQKHRSNSFSIVLKGKVKVKDRDVIVLDDLTKSGSTLLKAKETLHEQGARNVVCAVTHVTPTLENGEKLLEQLFQKLEGQLIVSDSVYTEMFGKQNPNHSVSILPELIKFGSLN